MKIKLLLIFLLLQCFCFSQTRHFQHLTNAEGISQSEVYTFLEDSRGFMWFGTVDGLNHYDGYTITTFNTDKYNINSIPNNTIRSLAEDDMGRIWIGTDDGLCVYDPLLEKIFQIKIAYIIEGELLQIRSIIINGSYILLGTSIGMLRSKINMAQLNQIEKGFKRVEFEENPHVSILKIRQSRSGAIWILTARCLYRVVFQGESQNPIVVDKLTDKRFVNNLVVEEDKLGNLWIISHDNGFYRYSPSTKKLDHFSINKPNSSVVSRLYSCAVCDNNGNLWISSRDRGLLMLQAKKLNDANPQFENITNVPFDDKSLNSNLIYSLYVSSNNLLWVGTIGSGVNIYNPYQKAFNYLKIPFYSCQNISTSNFIRSVYADNDGNILMGTQNNGLYFYNRKSGNFSKEGYENQSIYYIHDIGDGNMLICRSNGVSLVKLTSNRVREVSSAFTNAYFYSYKSSIDIVWLAGLGGITKCRLANGRIIQENIYNNKSKFKTSINNCRVVFYDNNRNELLVGTEGGGLNIFELDDQQNVQKVKVYKKDPSANSISNNYIRSITRDSNGDIWIGTFEGLNKLLRDEQTGEVTFKSYTKRDGLPNNMIQLLVEDNRKMLWIGTNGGLCKFDPAEEKFVNYSLSEGLQSNEFSEHAVFKKSDGEIIMGGINGINMFYPQEIVSPNIPPKTTITGFHIFNKRVEISDGKDIVSPLTRSITLTDTILLKPNQTSFGFDFSAMLHSTPEKVKYAYMLKGFDKDWNYTDAKNRRANYTNLKYNEYTFMVKSTNTDGEWEQTPRTVFINLKTPFIYTWVAFASYILIIMFVIIYFTNYSVIKYTTKKKMLLDSEHNKMLHELDQLRTRFFINISHDLRTPLTLISSPLNVVLKNNKLSLEDRENLHLAYRNIKKMTHITEQLLDLSKAETGKLSVKLQQQDIISFIKNEVLYFNQAIKAKGLDLCVISRMPAIYTCFDQDMISKVLFNILSNAIKYTHKGEICVRIERVSGGIPEKLKDSKYRSFIKIDVADSGDGIEIAELERIFERYYQVNDTTTKGYGIGLSHCKDLIEAHQGHIEASSQIGVGTIFTLFIPYFQNTERSEEHREIVCATEDIYIKSFDESTDESMQQNVSRQKILVIEDNDDMRNFIVTQLKKEYLVSQSEAGEQGLEMAVKQFPDLIISDVMMPIMDGIELCRRVKSDIKTSHIPVILLTASDDPQSKYEGIEMGADDYILKPFEMDYLLLRIKNILQSREQLRKLFQVNNKLNPATITVSSLDEKFLSQFMKAMEEGIPDSEFTVNLLESKMGMSHSSFYRKIKNLTGQSGKDILFNMRMKRAKQILIDSKDIRISEVAYMVGYTNPKYFSQSFKDFYGVLPSEVSL